MRRFKKIGHGLSARREGGTNRADRRSPPRKPGFCWSSRNYSRHPWRSRYAPRPAFAFAILQTQSAFAGVTSPDIDRMFSSNASGPFIHAMKIATYNVNGIRARLPLLLRWL